MSWLLISARTGSIVSLASFLVTALAEVQDSIKAVFIAATMFCLFADATISYVYPRLAKQTPSNSLLAAVYQVSFFYDQKATRGYTLAMVILFGVLFFIACAKLLGYW